MASGVLSLIARMMKIRITTPPTNSQRPLMILPIKSYASQSAAHVKPLPNIAFDNSPGQAHYGSKMKPAPAVPGDTEAERMKNALRMMFSVPKEAYLREEARLKRARDRKRRKRNS